MILLEVPEKRGPEHDLWLGGTTAAVAGFVNVCSVVAFFAFASNVTGHVAVFAEELVKGHWHQFMVVLAWVSSFIGGAFVANLSVGMLGPHSPRFARAVPLVLEIALLAGVGFYGEHHYAETLTETEYLVAILLFTMGLQNSMVATVSKGVVKTTHLTGLSTDLGMEMSMILQPRHRNDARLRFKLKLHMLIFVAYVLGGVVGGTMFVDLGFRAFHLVGVMLVFVLVHDLVVMSSAAARLPRSLARGAEMPSFRD